MINLHKDLIIAAALLIATTNFADPEEAWMTLDVSASFRALFQSWELTCSGCIFSWRR